MIYRTGGRFIGPTNSLKKAIDVARNYYPHVEPGAPVITVYEEVEPGVEKLIKTYYRPIEGKSNENSG
jgi:hypothetical protein